MAKVITKEDITAAVGKGVARATAAETKRCITAVKGINIPEDKAAAKATKAAIAAAVAAIKATPAA